MTLTSALSIANSALTANSAGFGVVAQNIANAQTPLYGRAVLRYGDLSAGDQALGVQALPPARLTDLALEASLFGANGQASAGATSAAALAGISPALGSVGSGNDLGGMIDALGNGFTALLGNPADTGSQLAVVQAASQLCGGIQSLAACYAATRQDAQNALVSGIATLNANLAQIGALNRQIEGLAAQGRSTADAENARTALEGQISNLVDVRFVQASDGSVSVIANGGLQLPTDGSASLQIAPAALGAAVYYPGGGIGAIMLGGNDVTKLLGGGSIGANLALRDQTIPQMQAGLDELSFTLAQRFDAQGLRLFSRPDGSLPAGGGVPVQSGYVGFAATITVNPAVAANPALVRDGDHAVGGSPTGASAFVPNPQNLPGFSGLITRILSFALGAQAQPGVAQPAAATSGLGPAGTLSVPASGDAPIGDFARAITASQAQTIAQAAAAQSEAQAAQTSLTASLSAREGVSTDSELSQLVSLQNAYGASAKIIAAIQQAMGATLNMVSS